jgi:cobalt-zinc-cadmium resistance protein CzcA
MALRHAEPVIVFALVIIALGLYAYEELAIEAYPNPVPPMVEIVAQPKGASAEEVERTVTQPIEDELASTPDLQHIRSISMFGLADVKCYFSWNADHAAAQQRVVNRMSAMHLREGVAHQITGWSAIGEVYRYRVSGQGFSLADLRTAEDWILERQFRQVPGVIDVIGFGGETKQYQVIADPIALKANQVRLEDAIRALSASNENVGGGEIAHGEQSVNVRGGGLLRSIDDVGDIVVRAHDGTQIRLRDLATVVMGAAPRLGLVGEDADSDIVEGIVLMRAGGDSERTIRGIESRIEYIKTHEILPKGMTIEPIYDRARFLKATWRTVHQNLIVGLLIAAGILLLLFGHVRAAAIAIVNAPFGLMVANIGLWVMGTPANLVSFGAVDFGIVMAGSVVVTDAILRILESDESTNNFEKVLRGTVDVGSPMFFASYVMAASFVPLFAMKGAAGAIFSPMARMYVFAILGAACAAWTLTPVLMDRLIPDRGRAEQKPSWLMVQLLKIYRPMIRWAVANAKAAVVLVLAMTAGALALTPLLGREFMPKIEEGNFWIRATVPLSISLAQSAKYAEHVREIVRGCSMEVMKDPARAKKECKRPEIETVVTQIGRPDDGTDTSSFYNIEVLAELQPPEAWRPGVTKRGLRAELAKELLEAFPGVVFNFAQAIEDNVDEASSGVKAENAVKVFGRDLVADESVAKEIAAVLSEVAGIQDLGVYRSIGQPSVRISPDRTEALRYGIDIDDVEAAIRAAIGVQPVAQVYEDERQFDLVVRWKEDYRDDLKSIREIPLQAKDGSAIPLGRVAQVREDRGPAIVYREHHERYVPVKFSVRGRDVGSTIAEARFRVGASVSLPAGVHIDWSGTVKQLDEATRRLMIAVPIALFLIVFLVYASAKTWRDTLIVLCDIPIAWAGGVVLLLSTGTSLSISAAMGLIAIEGVAVLDALIVVTSAARLRSEGVAAVEAARKASEERLRAVLGVSLVTMATALPVAISLRIGTEAQKPLAIVLIGGALALLVGARLIQPALLVLMHGKSDRA